VREAQGRHVLAPTASAAVGRLISGAALLGASLGPRERLTLQINGDGPIGSIVADSWSVGNARVAARAYARYPAADIPLNERGKFDVAGVIGRGRLQVTKSYAVGQPYKGIVPLETGEIGEDIAAYLASSQQVPSVVALGVLANPEGIVAAGGIIAQLMPGADDATIATLERNAKSMPPVTQQIVDGSQPEALLRSISASLELKIFRDYSVEFGCRCTREKVESALLGLGRDELTKMASEQPQTEATCEFCKRQYVLTASEVSDLVARLDVRG
jgi:molecular chaperone Hsp33